MPCWDTICHTGIWNSTVGTEIPWWEIQPFPNVVFHLLPCNVIPHRGISNPTVGYHIPPWHVPMLMTTGKHQCIPNPGCMSRISEPEARRLDAESWMQSPGCRVLDQVSWSLELGSCILDPGLRLASNLLKLTNGMVNIQPFSSTRGVVLPLARPLLQHSKKLLAEHANLRALLNNTGHSTNKDDHIISNYTCVFLCLPSLSLSLSLSIYLSLYLSVSAFTLSLSIYLSLYPSPPLSVYMYAHTRCTHARCLYA